MDCAVSPIVGGIWFSRSGTTIVSVDNMGRAKTTREIVNKFQNGFDTTLGKYKGPPVELELTDKAISVAFKSRNPARVLREPVEQELAKLEGHRIKERLDYASECQQKCHPRNERCNIE